ncbi:MAG: hypothetical protein NVS2B16_31260 [Chloroflexota bacterium]
MPFAVTGASRTLFTHVLDVIVHEDQSRIRTGYAAENVAVLRHPQRVPGAEFRPAVAINLSRQQTVKRTSIKGRRLKAAWDTQFLLQVLRSG